MEKISEKERLAAASDMIKKVHNLILQRSSISHSVETLELVVKSVFDSIQSETGLNVNVLMNSYDYTLDYDGNIYGLVCGDMGFEPIGIKASKKEEHKWDLVEKDTDFTDLALSHIKEFGDDAYCYSLLNFIMNNWNNEPGQATVEWVEGENSTVEYRFETGKLRHNEMLIENFKEHQSMIWESTNVYKDDDSGVYVFRVLK
jgi:hypothetical protein